MLAHRRLGVVGTTVAAALLLAGCSDADPDDELSDPPPTPDEQPGDDEAPGDEGDGDGGGTSDGDDDDTADDDSADDSDSADDGTPDDGDDGTPGDGRAGWLVEYVDEARAQGSGALVDVDGDAVLRVAIRNVPLPPDLPDTIEIWDEDRLRAPSGGVVTEVVNDTIFEGQHTFFIGTMGEQPFLIERLDDPQRVVIDLFHD